MADILNKKLIEAVNRDDFKEEAFQIYFQTIEQDIKLFREENIPIYTKIDLKSNEYSELMASLTINYNNKSLTLQQASVCLESTSRTTRKNVFEKVKNTRLEHKININDTYTELINLRHQLALNAGYSNYRDYSFDAMCRFDYTIDQNLELLDSIRDEILPIISIIEKLKSISPPN